MTVYRQLQEHRYISTRKLPASYGRKLCADIPTGCSMCRKAELITQSRDWIRPEDLDRRIEEVLNYPTKMFR